MQKNNSQYENTGGYHNEQSKEHQRYRRNRHTLYYQQRSYAGTSNPLVMIPGPTPVVRSIQDQMGRETIAFNDPRFIADFQDLLTRLKVLWRCDGLAFVVAGSGTMAMEMGIANITDKNDRVLVCSNGHFGDSLH
jgi:Serine-pyruvate aminotransferase/archaeal aspartate aminotransferase